MKQAEKGIRFITPDGKEKFVFAGVKIAVLSVLDGDDLVAAGQHSIALFRQAQTYGNNLATGT